MTIREKIRSFKVQSLKKIPIGWILPVLVASYPIIYLYSQNVQIVSSLQLVLPLSIAWAGSLILWAIFSLITKDTKKGGVISTVFVVFFFAYGYLFDWVTAVSALELRHRHFLPITLFIAGYIGYFIAIAKKPELFKNVFKVSCVVVAFLLVVNIVPIIPAELQKCQMGIHQDTDSSEATSGTADPTANYPDIYYIVLDEYASFETQETVWGYKNSEFKKFLESKGFFIAEKSRTHSVDTIVVVPSILNFRAITGLDYNDLLELIVYINDNQAMKLLSAKGYTTVAIGVHTINSDINIQSDYVFRMQDARESIAFNKFHWLLIDVTMLRPFSFVLEPAISDYLDLERHSRLYDINKIIQLSDIPSPKFVYAHIMLPHEPFLFDSDGNKIYHNDRANYRNKGIYLEQLIFTTRKMEDTIDALLKQYPESEPPVIIIQSDHGLRIKHDGISEYLPEGEQFKVLNAFLLPGYDYKILEQNIPPIEVLPLVIDCYINNTTS